MSYADYVVLGIVALALIAVAVYMIRKRRKGESIGCCGDCLRCSGCQINAKKQK